MNTIVFDTETTGLLPKQYYSYFNDSYNIQPDTLSDFPYMIQLSFIIFNHNKKKINTHDFIIKLPPNVEISERSIELHNITREISDTKGKSIIDVLYAFSKNIIHGYEHGYQLVGHNISFDLVIIKVELMRLIWNYSTQINKEQNNVFKNCLYCLQHYPTLNIICTMKSSIDYCKLPSTTNKKGYKWPKLLELHETMFGCVPNNLHNSLYDILITLRCFVKYFYHIDLLDCCKEFQKYTMPLYNFEYKQDVQLRRSERLKYKYIT